MSSAARCLNHASRLIRFVCCTLFCALSVAYRLLHAVACVALFVCLLHPLPRVSHCAALRTSQWDRAVQVASCYAWPLRIACPPGRNAVRGVPRGRLRLGVPLWRCRRCSCTAHVPWCTLTLHGVAHSTLQMRAFASSVQATRWMAKMEHELDALRQAEQKARQAEQKALQAAQHARWQAAASAQEAAAAKAQAAASAQEAAAAIEKAKQDAIQLTTAKERAEELQRTAEEELERTKAAVTKLESQLQEERRASEAERIRLVAVSLGPPTSFAASNFKRAYDEAGHVRITHATQVFGFLVTFVHTYCQVHGLNSELERIAAASFVEKLQRAIADRHGTRALDVVVGEVGATAELLWTSLETFLGMREHTKEFCALLNAAIRSDVARLMPCTAALVRAINALCVAGRKGEARAEFPPNGRTFRGTAFSNEHRRFFVRGRKYRAPGFVATSFDEITALGFAVRHGLDLGKPAVMWEVRVEPAGEHDPTLRCKHVNYVKGLVGGEKEYLFTAYSVFTVLHVEWNEDDKTLSRIVLKAALDNSEEDEGLPLAPWY
jgi:hypothetical protein